MRIGEGEAAENNRKENNQKENNWKMQPENIKQKRVDFGGGEVSEKEIGEGGRGAGESCGGRDLPVKMEICTQKSLD